MIFFLLKIPVYAFLFNLLQVLICWVIAQNLKIHNTATGHGKGKHAEKISNNIVSFWRSDKVNR